MKTFLFTLYGDRIRIPPDWYLQARSEELEDCRGSLEVRSEDSSSEIFIGVSFFVIDVFFVFT